MISLSGCALLAGFLGAQTLVALDEKKTAADRARQDFELMRLFADAYEQIDSSYVREVDRRKLVDAAIRGMASHLDPHSTFIPPEDLAKFEQRLDQEFVGIGIHVQNVNNRLEIIRPLPGSPAWRAGIRNGDVILEIDGRSTTGMTPEEAGRLLAGIPGRPVVLGVRKPQAEQTEQVTVVRERIQLPTVAGVTRRDDLKWDFMLNPAEGIGYIGLMHFSRNTADEVESALKDLMAHDLKALILDVRSNPGGLMESAVAIADLFLDAGPIVSMKGRVVPEKKWTARKGELLCSVPLIVLTNRQSASASEVLSACLQDNKRAVIIGERTWGKGSVQNVVSLEDGKSALKITTASYFRPSGVNIHRFPDSKKEDAWGVMPDEGHLVELTKDEWTQWLLARETRDAAHQLPNEPADPTFVDRQLQHGVEWLRKQMASAAAGPIAEGASSGSADASEKVDSPK
ncbi:MAG: S41 family peptidase [Planctomycetota bacterium]